MDSSWMMFDRHLYPGGALRIHMLRHLLGERHFWSGVQSYVQQSWGQVVETDDFRRVLERQSGRSLARFFDQWLGSPGYPALDVRFSHDAEKGRGHVSIVQKQVTDKSDSPPAFYFDLDVAIEHADGSWTTEIVEVRGPRAALAWPQTSVPRQVVLDPGGKVLFKATFEPGDDILARTLEAGPTVYARAHAAETLGRLGRGKHVALLIGAYGKEQAFGVREAIARALGAAGSRAAAAGLVALLPGEKDPRVRLIVLNAMRQYREPEVAEAAAQWLAAVPRLPLATAAALGVLGAQRGQAPLSTISAHLDGGGPWGHERRGALAALGASHAAAVIAPLVAVVEDRGELRQVRLAAAPALAEAGRAQERHLSTVAREALEDLTRDPDTGLRLAAVRALAALGDPAARRVVAAASTHLPIQDRPTVQRAVDRLTATGKDGRDRRIEDLEARVRKLSERVDELES
jgi:aminopeptidase N